MNADTERELFTRSSWSNPEDSLTQMDFIMTSRKLEMKHVQVLDSGWFKTDHRAVLAVLSMKPKMGYAVRNGVNLRGWEPDEAWLSVAAETLAELENWNAMVPLLMDNGDELTGKVETKEMSVTEIETQIASVEKEENRTALPSEHSWIGKDEQFGESGERSIWDQDQESVQRWRKPPRKHKASISSGVRLQNKKTPKMFSQTSSKTSTRFLETRKEPLQSERHHWVELWKT